MPAPIVPFPDGDDAYQLSDELLACPLCDKLKGCECWGVVAESSQLEQRRWFECEHGNVWSRCRKKHG